MQKIVVSPMAQQNYLPVTKKLLCLGARRLSALHHYRHPYPLAQAALSADDNGGYRSLRSKQVCADPLGIRPIMYPW